MRSLLFKILLFLSCISHAWGSESADQLLPLGLDAAEETVAVTARSPRPVSRIAENVTVVTAEQIALLNAHTLADVLQTVPGIFIDRTRTPGAIASFFVQGAPNNHVQLLIDGVQQSELVNNQTDPGSIPAHYIERVEIIKGAASAVWGPALGGVINVITKSPDRERSFGGGGLASYGERGTSDLQLETSGTLQRLGYYLSGSALHSRGLLPNNAINNNDLFTKLTYDLPGKGVITAGLDFRFTNRGTTLSPPDFYDYQERIGVDYFTGYLNLSYPLAEKLTLDLLAREWRQRFRNTERDFSGENIHLISNSEQKTYGGTAKLIWGDAHRNLTGGVEYEHSDIDVDARFAPDVDTPAPKSKSMDRYGLFANGAYTFGAFTILPGIRYDRVDISSDYLSYTLGATYQLTDKTTFRTYAARAYSLPYVLLAEGIQKVWTVQTGLESGSIPYLWLKGTFFYNIIDDQHIDFSADPAGEVVLAKEKRQGFELEARTVPWRGFSLSSGYTYTDDRDRDTGEKLHNYPENLAKLGLNYNDKSLGLKGALTGNYVWLNLASDFDGHTKPIIWDISLTQKLLPGKELSPEIFFSGHNLFNGSQYSLKTFDNNARRWLEGGVRFRF
jgi:vitamin B12 transporter